MKIFEIIGKIILYLFTGILFLFPIWLYLIGVFECQSHIDFLKNNWLRFVIIVICVIVIVLVFTLNSLHLKNSNQSNSFKDEIWYLLKNGKPAWMLGLAVSNIIIALYFFIPSTSPVDRFGTSFTVFIGIIAIFLGIHILYEKEAPIIGTISLLEKLNKDLERFLKSKGGNLYFVFPALNLGFYTEAIDRDTVKEGIFGFDEETGAPCLRGNFSISKLENNLRAIAKSGNFSNRKAIIYNDVEGDEGYLQKLYMTYHYMIFKKIDCQRIIEDRRALEIAINSYYDENRNVVEKCVESAKIISTHFDNPVKVKPNALIQPVIVIGDIVYVIADYGMPYYDVTGKFFVPLKDEGQPVELICWRRTDKALANQIVNHINNFIETERNT